MTDPIPALKTLSFHCQKFELKDSEGHSVLLADLRSDSDWENIPWKNAEIGAIDLGDLPCRLSGPALAVALKKIWQMSADDAVIKLRIPHPRHDVFLMDLGYVRGLLPETLAQLDPRHSTTGLATQLGVRFEVLETSLTLDPHWQKAIEEEKITYADIQLISKQALNVIEWIEMQLQVKKSFWVQTNSSPLDEGMRKQLLDQLQAHTARGDEQAAAVIRQFLENSSHSVSSEKIK